MDSQDSFGFLPMIHSFTHQILTEQLLGAKPSVEARTIGTKAADFASKEL